MSRGRQSKYTWPSSLLDAASMHRLMEHRQRSGERITVAIRSAVDAYCDASEERAAREALRVSEGNGEQSGTPRSAVHRIDRYTDASALRERPGDG